MSECGTIAEDRGPVIVVICSDEDRYLAWARVLIEAGAAVVLAKASDDVSVRIDKGNLVQNGKPDKWRPVDAAAAVLIHSGDYALWNKDVTANKKFLFNGPGSPAPKEGGLPIYRATDTNQFEITVPDAAEIIAYSLGRRHALPACCSPRTQLPYLSALAVLCQGYLASQAVYQDGRWGPVEIARSLRQMGLIDEASSNPIFFDSPHDRKEYWRASLNEGQRFTYFERNIRSEYGRNVDTSLASLLASIGSGEDTLSLKTVAEAYCAVVKRLGGDLCPKS